MHKFISMIIDHFGWFTNLSTCDKLVKTLNSMINFWKLEHITSEHYLFNQTSQVLDTIRIKGGG